jgi:hypothetical protein
MTVKRGDAGLRDVVDDVALLLLECGGDGEHAFDKATAGRAEDEQTPPDFSRRLQAHVRGSRLVVFPGCAHFMMLESPAEFRLVLREFLDELEPPGF